MYDIVSELNASKTQVFECKQDCGRYLSFHCHMQSHSCEFCSCICFTCLSSKTSHTTSTTAGIDVPAINTSGTATDVVTTADDSPAIIAIEALNDATTANDDPGAITSGAVDETATAGIDVPAVNTSGTATDVMVAADASPAIADMESMNGAVTATDDPGAITSGAVDETATAGINVPAVNISGAATDVMVAADASPVIADMESMNGAVTATDDPDAITTGAVDETATAGNDVNYDACQISSVPATNIQAKRITKLMAKNAPNCKGVQQADKYKFYLEHFDPCDLWYQDISVVETMLGCLPDDDRELIVHVSFCSIENHSYVLFWNDPGNTKNWLIEIVQPEAYTQMISSG